MTCLICKECTAAFPLNEPRWKCDCGHVLDIEHEACFDLGRIRERKPTQWRYREAIPLEDDRNITSFDEGFTPMVEIEFKGRHILVKQDHLFPTGSYKDRGASVLISKVKELGISKVVEDSSGNAGCAIAAYCARAGVESEIFVPADTSHEKIVQLQCYGAKIHRVPGTREDTAAAAFAAAKDSYYASHSWNPFFFHGTKTFAFEVCEQLGWHAPDSVVLPAGNGTLLLGTYIGFSELVRAEIIDRIPRLVAVQSASCAPLYKAFKQNLSTIPRIEKEETVAEGIAIADPVRGAQIIEAVRKSGGDFIVVNDSEIKESLKEVCGRGFFIEPTSAATIAGLFKYLNQARPAEVIVSVFTGHGLKSAEKLAKMMAP